MRSVSTFIRPCAVAAAVGSFVAIGGMGRSLGRGRQKPLCPEGGQPLRAKGGEPLCSEESGEPLHAEGRQPLRAETLIPIADNHVTAALRRRRRLPRSAAIQIKNRRSSVRYRSSPKDGPLKMMGT